MAAAPSLIGVKRVSIESDKHVTKCARGAADTSVAEASVAKRRDAPVEKPDAHTVARRKYWREARATGVAQCLHDLLRLMAASCGPGYSAELAIRVNGLGMKRPLWIDSAMRALTTQGADDVTIGGVFSVRQISDARQTELAALRAKPVRPGAKARDWVALSTRDQRVAASVLRFDIDADVYAERVCCGDRKQLCDTCAPLFDLAMRVIERVLRYLALPDLDADMLTWAFSGRRGVHGWLLDPRGFVAGGTPTPAPGGGAPHALHDIVGSIMHIFIKASASADLDCAKSVADSTKLVLGDVPRPLPPVLAHVLGAPDAPDSLWVAGPDLARTHRWLSRADARTATLGHIANAGVRERTRAWLESELAVGQVDEGALWTSLLAQLPLYERQRLALGALFPRIDVGVTRTPSHLVKAPFSTHVEQAGLALPLLPGEPFVPSRLPTVHTPDLASALVPYVAHFRQRLAAAAARGGITLPPSTYAPPRAVVQLPAATPRRTALAASADAQALEAALSGMDTLPS